MSRDRHPAGRHLTVVKDTAAVAEWWEAERAAARRDVAIARLAHGAGNRRDMRLPIS